MFALSEKEYIRVDEKKLREVVEQIFIKMSVPSDDALLCANVLVSADLRGVESHGVSNMLKKYVRDYRNGKLNPNPDWKIIRESPATATIDADRGLGLLIAQKAMDIAIEKAKKTGIGMVTIRNVGHMGMVAYYPMMALAHNMIGLALTSTPPEVLPTFGAEPRLGTNPIAFAAPGNVYGNFVYDAATSVISNNTLSSARRLGTKLPPGWIAEGDGSPAMHGIEPSPEGRSKARLLPLGSTPELGSHKGYGLGGIVDILSGILSGAGYGAMVGRGDYAHTVVAYNIESFIAVDEFKEKMDEWLQMLNATKPSPGHSYVYYAGEIEAEYEKKNKLEGIPLHSEVVAWIRDMSTELGIESSL